MNKQNRKRRILVLLTAMAAMLLLPQTSTAQYDETRYGLQPWFSTSLMGRECGRGGDGSYNLHNQQFSDDEGGFNLYNQFFEVPLGSGLLILTAAGAGYALKKRKSNNKTVSG